jgi:hypothetical protein
VNRAQLGEELVGGRPPPWILGQAALDQRPDPAGQPARVRQVVDDPVEQLGGRTDPERALADGGERQHGAQAEDVTGRSGLFA